MADTAGGRGTQSLRRSGGQSGERHAYSDRQSRGHSEREARPNAFGDKAVRLLILSEVDQSAHIKSCATMSCATEKLESGMTVEFDSGPRLLYWFVANGQRVQASGTAEPSTMKLTANTPQKLTGNWAHDASGQGGPKIAAEFDAPLLKEFTKAR